MEPTNLLTVSTGSPAARSRQYFPHPYRSSASALTDALAFWERYCCRSARIKILFTVIHRPPNPRGIFFACFFRRFRPCAPALQVVGEGSVGVVRFGGRILEQTKAPGFHFVLPLLYELTEVPVNVRT